MTKLSNEEKYTVRKVEAEKGNNNPAVINKDENFTVRKVEAEVINKDENYVVQEVVEDKGSYMEILKLDEDYQVKGLN